MNVRSEQLEPHVVTLIVNIEKGDYEADYEAKLRESRKSLSLKGFRPGHVPMALAQRMLGPRIRLDMVQKKLDEAIQMHLRENDMLTFSRFLSNAQQMEMDPEQDGNFEFRLDVGIVPEVPAELLPKTTLFEPEIDDAFIEKGIEDNRSFYGTEEPCDAVAAGTVLAISLFPVTNGEVQRPEDDKIMRRRVDFDHLSEVGKGLVLGKKVGDAVEVKELGTLMADAEEQSRIFGHRPSDPYELGETVQLEIETILERKLAEVNAAFFANFVDAPEGGSLPEDLGELRAMYKEQREHWFTHGARLRAGDWFFEQVLKAWDFTVSDEFIGRMLTDAEQPTEDASVLESHRAAIKAEGLSMRLFRMVDWDKIDRDDIERYGRFLASQSVIAACGRMGFPAGFFKTVNGALRFGFSMFGEKLKPEMEQTQQKYVGVWCAMQQAGVEVKRAPVEEVGHLMEECYGTEAAE